MRRPSFDPYLILLLILSLPALAPLLAPGYFYAAHDGRHSVFYISMFDAALRDGAWWPRWAMHHNQGMGYPTFLIQAPLGHYLAEAFVLLGAGYTLAAKCAWVVGFLAGAWGMYRLVLHWLPQPPWSTGAHTEDEVEEGSRLDGQKLAAVAAGALYVYFPYHIAGIYVRGALNDTLLLAWLPWLFLAFDRLLLGGAAPGWTRRLGLAMLVLAGLLLTHTFALLSIAPFLVVFVFFRLGQAWVQRGLPWRQATLAAAGGLGGLLLTSIFLLPLLAEGRYLQQQVFVGNTYDFRHHFVQVGQFFSPFWGFGYSDDPQGANDTMGFQVGALLVILALVGLFTVPRAQRERGLLVFLLGAGAALLLLMTPLARPVWEAVPALAVIQFPWRLLALAGFVFSAVGGLALWNLLPGAVPDPRPEGGLVLVSILAIAASYPYLQANLQPVEPWRADGRAVFQFEQEHPDMLGYTAWVTEPFTRTAVSPGYERQDYQEVRGDAPGLPRLEIAVGAGTVVENYSRGSSAGGVVNMATPGTVQIDVYYFPGWSVAVDGQPAAIRPSAPTGAILVDVPAGEHRIDARFDVNAVGTPPRALGAAVSGAMLLAVIALLAWPVRSTKPRAPAGA